MKSRAVSVQINNVPGRSRMGLTTIELLIVIAIIAMLSAAGAAIFGNLQPRAQLLDVTAEVVQSLRTAQARSAARYNLDPHGVYVQSSGITLYQGDSYAARESQYDRVISYGAVMLSSTSTDFHFGEGNGIPSATGTITITHPGLNLQSTIQVLSTGKILEL